MRKELIFARLSRHLCKDMKQMYKENDKFGFSLIQFGRKFHFSGLLFSQNIWMNGIEEKISKYNTK